MKLFTCPVCRQLLFFENVQCTRCGHRLAYLPEHAVISALEPVAPEAAPDEPKALEEFVALGPAARGERYRLCRNAVEHGVCNWAVPASHPEPYCLACRLNRVIPNLADPLAKIAWLRVEQAKRRLLYTLLELGLPVEADANAECSLAFAFKQDGPEDEPVVTGHAAGLITLNISEADDAHRERTRLELEEPYRTVLGHLRHESGHYYWERLIRDTDGVEAFRQVFGDERADYDAARETYYASKPAAGWSENFISAYAAMHPWEDWAETWAHYLHMADTVETARSYGLALRPDVAGSTTGDAPAAPPSAFDELIAAWFPLTLALNSLNRSMGLNDPYPFALSAHCVRKLRFVHEVIAQARPGAARRTTPRPTVPDAAVPQGTS